VNIALASIIRKTIGIHAFKSLGQLVGKARNYPVWGAIL
jgi:hypothetical protein